MKSNPFATRFVRPGQLEWLADGDNSLPCLVERFRCQYDSRAIVVGPHGSGKSTLLEHLVPRLGYVVWRQFAGAKSTQLESQAVPAGAHPPPQTESSLQAINDVAELCDKSAAPIVWLSLRRQEQPMHKLADSRRFWRRAGLLVIDGWEQLSTWQAIRVCWSTRRTGMGLLATCHRDYWLLPTLVTTTATAEHVQRLVRERLASAGCLSAKEQHEFSELALLTQLLKEEQGSVREVFMRLYDRYEDY